MALNITSGIIDIPQGGTNAGTAPAARVNLLPALAGNAGRVLAVNAGATDVEYIPVTGGGGTVTSVGLSMPADFSVANSPISTLGTLAVTYNSQAANLFLASPNGTAGAPSYRSIVAADIPTLNQNTTGSAATLTTARTINGISFNGSANILIPSLYDSNYRRIMYPSGAEYNTSTASITGAIAINLPTAVFAQNRMISFTVQVYDYATNESFTAKIAGYTFSTGWVNCSAYILGNPSIDLRFNVRFSRDATNSRYIVYIGELSTVWAYPQVYVTDLQVGFTSNTAGWETGWSITFEATAFQSVNATVSNSQVGYSTSTNIGNALVLRDGSGNFSAGTITATLSGNATNVTGTVAIANGGTGATTAAAARTALQTPTSTTLFPASNASGVLAADIRNITNPTTGLSYAQGVRFRFSSLNDDSSTPYADVIDLSTYQDSSGGGFNSLYFGKNSQLIQHKYAAAAGTSWTTKTLAYTDSTITGNAANVTGTVAIANGGTGATSAGAALTALGAQATLVSGTNIKTINSTSVLGSGDIFISGGVTYTRITAATTLTNNQGVIADTTGGVFTINLPAAPTSGNQVWIADGGNWSTNNLTVDPNGSTIEGFAVDENLVCNVGGIELHLLFDGTRWNVHAIAGGSGGTAVTETGTQTLTNKTLTSPVITQNVQVISTNTTAIASRTYVLTSTLTLTLPASPIAGTWVTVINRSATVTPIVARNAQNIMGLAEDLTIDSLNVPITLTFADSTRGWVLS